MKMFFSRADAVTLWESECRLRQEAVLQCSPSACPTIIPWGQGAWLVLGVGGYRAALGNPADREVPFPFYSPIEQYLIYSFPELTLLLLNAFWGSKVQARGVEKLKANAWCAGANVYESRLLYFLEFCKPVVELKRY